MTNKEKIKEIARNFNAFSDIKLNEKNLEFLLTFSELDVTIIKGFIIHTFMADSRKNGTKDISLFVSYNHVFYSLNATLTKNLEVKVVECIPNVGFLQSERALELLIEMIVESGIMKKLLDHTL